MIKRAVISVHNKKGLQELVDTLRKFDVQIISSGGTYRKIKEIGYENLVKVSEYTGFSESPEGLVKTLHPKIHGGLLLDRQNIEHRKWMSENGVKPIDLVVNNLYPFEKVIAEGVSPQKAFDNIDIGGPTLTRSAAKASLLYGQVCIVIHPSQYSDIIKTLKANNGEISTELKKNYALEAFKRTAEYDFAIVRYMEEK